MSKKSHGICVCLIYERTFIWGVVVSFHINHILHTFSIFFTTQTILTHFFRNTFLQHLFPTHVFTYNFYRPKLHLPFQLTFCDFQTILSLCSYTHFIWRWYTSIENINKKFYFSNICFKLTKCNIYAAIPHN